MVCLSVCTASVTLVHPAKAVGRNEMPFGRDTRGVVAGNIVLHRGSGPPRKRGDLGAETPVRSDAIHAAYRQITVTVVVVAVVIGPLFIIR